MKQCVILNPNAGSAAQVEERISAIGPHELLLTKVPGDATRLARQAVANGFDRVIAAGGDGTLNEVVNGLVGAPRRVEMGLLPLGTANDFARTVNIPPDLEGAAAVLEAGRKQEIDVVKLTPSESPAHYFINVSAGGFSTKVDKNIDKQTKVTWGSLGYAISALKAFPELEPYEATLTFDDEPSVTVLIYNLVVANARFVGGGIPVAPEADLGDGLFDVIVFRAVTLTRLMTLVPKAMLGQHLDDDDVLYRRAGRFEVSSQPPFELNTDGEVIGRCPATFEIVPRAITFVVGTPADATT